MPEVINEKMGVHKEWYVEARGMTLDQLPKFVQRLTKDYQHDCGTICHAIAAAAVGAAWSVERGPQGGITGFQASCIMWEFITHWMTEYEGEACSVSQLRKYALPTIQGKVFANNFEGNARLSGGAREAALEGNVGCPSERSRTLETDSRWEGAIRL